MNQLETKDLEVQFLAFLKEHTDKVEQNNIILRYFHSQFFGKVLGISYYFQHAENCLDSLMSIPNLDELAQKSSSLLNSCTYETEWLSDSLPYQISFVWKLEDGLWKIISLFVEEIDGK